MKEKVIKILVFIILFNYIFLQFAFATEGEPSVEDSASSTSQSEEEAFNSANNNGNIVGPDGQTYSTNLASTQSSSGAISGTIAKALNVIPLLLNKIINYVANEGGFIDFNTSMTGGTVTEDDFKYITIEKILFGKYYLFNANIFKKSDDLGVTKKDGTAPDADGFTKTLDDIRDQVAQWYYIMRLIALILGLITLIYIGIRMAVSTVADDRAKYKKMLWAWGQSILIIVVLPYIMVLLNYVAQILMSIINGFRDSMISNGQTSFEIAIIDMVYGDLAKNGGFGLLAKVIVYSILTWAEFKFYMMYFKRFIVISFLTIISPLISITYSIDKAGDGKAQAFASWFREYMMNILIQPLQAILYLIFVFSANAIAVEAPIVGIIFILSLTRAEKIVKTIFNMRGLVSMNTMRLFKKGK